MIDVAAMARQFGTRPENSARSVLVTILGDSVVPLGGEVWLGDLIGLMAPFGFNERLVRTSVFRLTSEGWLGSERIGRRSRYRLTDYARREVEAADERIYHSPRMEWDGDWTLVFTDLADRDAHQRQILNDHLRWAGFARLSLGVRALPGNGAQKVRDLEARLDLAQLPVAIARFESIAPLLASGAVSEMLGTSDAQGRYAEVLERYESLGSLRGVVGRDAFSLRTMVVHDLRRAALVDPVLPRELLPADWSGPAARDVAAEVYRAVDAAAWAWLADLTGATGEAPGRFAA